MNAPPGPTRALATFASELRLADIPAGTREHVKLCALDTIGCGLFGAGLPWSTMVRDLVSADGTEARATLWGASARALPADAALVNGTACHGFELDDLHPTGPHPGASTVPAALAAAESAGDADGETLLTAIVAGYELGTRVARALGQAHFLAGFHPQGTTGVFCAVGAAGHVLRLDAGAFTHALGIAGTQGAGLMAAQEGAMVKRFHAGRAAQSGVYAAQLAARGFTGIENVLEAEFGGFSGTLRGDPTGLDHILDELGRTWLAADTGFKLYAASGAVHTCVEAIERLRQGGLRAEQVRRIVAHTSTHVLVHAGFPYKPVDPLAAQMNLQYALAAMLMDGELLAEQFTPRRIADSAILDLVRRVSVVAEPDLDKLGMKRRFEAWVEVETTDGRTLSERVSVRRGSPERPASRTDVIAKYHRLADGVLGRARATAVRETVLHLEELRDVAALTAALRVDDAAV